MSTSHRLARSSLSNSSSPKPRPPRTAPAPLTSGRPGTTHLHSNSTVTYNPTFLSSSAATALLSETVRSPSWERVPITIHGRSVLQPRHTAFFGTAAYTYSDAATPPTPWEANAASRAILALKASVEDELSLRPGYFNVCLCNRYDDGAQYMGYHADDEKSLGPCPIVASVSVGAERRFLLRPKPATVDAGAVEERIEYVLRHGSLLTMSGETQVHYKHSLPKMAACKEPRVNITFRRVVESRRG